MKKYLLYIFILGFISIMAACGSEEGNIITLSTDATNITLSNDNNAQQQITINTSVEWVINKPANADWLTIMPSKGKGITKVTFSALKNTSATRRTANVNIIAGDLSKTIIVAQQALVVALPDNAGIISGENENNCPYTATVLFTIPTIARATSYLWYRNGFAIAETTEPSYAAKATGAYTVAGKNSAGIGEASQEKRITITTCPLPGIAGSITGADQNICPVTKVLLTTTPVTNAVGYQWYKNGEAIPNATALTYTVRTTGTYTVAGVNGAGTGTVSSPKFVTINTCNMMDAILGDWTVTGQILVGSNVVADNHTITITKIDDNTVNIKNFIGIHALTGQEYGTYDDDIIATVGHENQTITVPYQELIPNFFVSAGAAKSYISARITVSGTVCESDNQKAILPIVVDNDGVVTTAFQCGTMTISGISYKTGMVYLAKDADGKCLGGNVTMLNTQWSRQTVAP